MTTIRWLLGAVKTAYEDYAIGVKLDEKFSWKNVEYDWLSPLLKENTIRTQKYVPENNLPLGLDLWKDELFINVPGFKLGVVSFLNYVNISSVLKNLILKPYPSWKVILIDITSNGTLADNFPIASAIRVRVDECDRLWVMDSGFIGYLAIQVKLPTIYIIDLNIYLLIKLHWFPISHLKDGSFFCVRTVYFHVGMQNRTRALSIEPFHDYYFVGDRGPNGQSRVSFLDEKSNVLFYAQINKDAVYCWNTEKRKEKPYNLNTQGVVDMNSDSLVFVNDLKVDRDGYLWVLSDRLPVFIYSKLNANQFNYRILRGKVSELIAGTACEYKKMCKQGWSSDFAYPN
ncbi:L-dopachrome tautomerase yellow-f2-like [Contarinia nasturtii]|uniref:L-dopachrome tautomerase yellow-f2-like n=1 Tax=Contarinia nasturtii TaxID=265458 RepID=UPI0012D4A1EE|nr:L-dopachrome tautomerase yellow-f2-like [Contarinia nasturtii]